MSPPQRRNVRMLVVNVVAKSRGIDYSKGNTNAVLFKFCKYMRSTKRYQHELMDWPTLAGLILIPSSTCADSGLSQILWERTSASQSVFTKVVRPVPEAPVMVSTAIASSCYWTPTDDHNSELNALDLVSPPSSDRHFGGDGSGTEYVWSVVRYRPLFMEWCEFINAASHE